jgi:hypothetical protein
MVVYVLLSMFMVVLIPIMYAFGATGAQIVSVWCFFVFMSMAMAYYRNERCRKDDYDSNA